MPLPTNNKNPAVEPPKQATYPPQHITKSHRLFVVIVLVWLAIAAVFVYNLQGIIDWVRLLGYDAPTNVVTLANEDTMTAYTRHLFYLNRPQLLPTVTSFRAKCPENENTIVIGCYHSNQDGIFIYAVTDPTLYGVQQVTAAHEVLHAVYARLSSSERTKLDNELLAYYHHGLTNARVQAEVKLYQKTEPGYVLNEMSCTFGTEIAHLPAALNNYYKKYFTNRQAIVSYEMRYQGEFTAREQAIHKDDAQLRQWESQINALESKMTNELSSLNTQTTSLDSLRSQGNISAYNAAVPAYNAAVDAYNAQVSTVESLVSQYNQLVVSRNKVAGQLTTLASALDTRVKPVAKTAT